VFKKLTLVVMLMFFGFFTMSINTFATTTTFTYTNAYSDYYYLLSDTVIMNEDAEVYVLNIPENQFTVYELGGVDSSIVFYSNADGTGTTETIDLFDLDPTLSVNKTYIVQIDDIPFPPLSVELILMTNIRTLSAPGGYVAFMASETEYSFTAPTSVKYYDLGNLFYSAYFINTVPEPPSTPSRSGFTFEYWSDINGDPYEFQLPPRLDQLNANGEFLLYAEFSDKSFVFTYTLFSGLYYLRSDIATINPQAEVLTFSVPENDFTTYTIGILASLLVFYTNADGTGSSQTVRLDNDLDDTLSVNKTYIVYLDDLNIVAKSVRLQLTTDLTSAQPPGGYMNYMNLNTNYDFTAPKSVKYYDGLNIYYSAYFVNNVPKPADPTKQDFEFIHWNDSNGDPYLFNVPPNISQLNENNELLLYAFYLDEAPVQILPDDWSLPLISTPIGILLNNTGFYTTEGFMILFVLLIIVANVALWYFKTPLFVNLIVSAVILVLFMVADYLPVYVSIAFIGLLVLLFFSVRGGLSNE